MAVISALTAQIQPSQLLDRASRGEEIVITRRGEPVAKLVPIQPSRDTEALAAAMRRMDERRERMSLRGMTAKDLVHEDHKY